jgi:hypothetical protein
MTKYENKELSKALLVVEDVCLINCTLTDCDLFYSGGDFEIVSVKFENCRWHFRGHAARTMALQQTIGMLKPIPMPPGPVFQANTGKAN